ATNDGDIRWSVILAVTRGILTEGDIELPVQPILNVPVITSRRQQCFRRQLARQHEDAHVGFDLAVNHSRRLDAAERREVEKLVVFGKPLCRNDDGGARLDTTVPAVLSL